MKYTSLFDLWEKTCEQFSDSIAFSDNKGIVKITYKQAFRMLCILSQKFLEYGLTRGEHVAVFASNSPLWLIIEQAVINNGCICVAKSPEISIEELGFVYKQSESSVLITDSAEILEYFVKNDFNLKFIFYSGNSELEDYKNCKAEIYQISKIEELYDENADIKTDLKDCPGDISYISYTSGTSSRPKGAMLKNIGMTTVIEQLQENRKGFSPRKTVVTCHISSMGWKAENLLYWSLGCETIYTHYKEFYETIEKFHPIYFQVPPKILQTIYSKLTDCLHKKNVIFRKSFETAFNISLFLLKLSRKIYFINFIKNIFNKIFDSVIFKKLRREMFDDGVLMDVGSAPLPKDIEDFFQIIGVNIIQSYGATETTGIAIGNTVQSQKTHPYSVGIPYKYNTVKLVDPQTLEEVKRGQSGLLIIKGPGILTGYYKNEEANNKALLKDNYYRTGDLATEDKDGYITILSRCDDVIVLTNGYNVYTRLLENEVKSSEFIEQIVIIGQGKPFLTAIIVLNKQICDNWLKEHNCQSCNINDNKLFKTFLIEHLNDKIKKKENHKYYEKLKDVYITFDNFTVENGLLIANTLKIKYNDVMKKYENEIKQMYERVF